MAQRTDTCAPRGRWSRAAPHDLDPGIRRDDREEMAWPPGAPMVLPPTGNPSYRRLRARATTSFTAAITACGCANDCGVHGHDHAGAWTSRLPIADLKGFFGALGCSCWAV